MTDVACLGSDAVRGDPDGMATVSRFLRATADEIHVVRNGLGGHGLAGMWEGAAADAFREMLRGTPDALERAARSYEMASDTVGRYATQLRTAHDTGQHLARRLTELLAHAARSDHAVRAGRQAVDAARRTLAHASDPSSHAHASRILDDRLRSLAHAEAESRSVHDQIAAVRRTASENRRALDAAARRTEDELRQASHAGIRNSVGSWLERHTKELRAVGKIAAQLFIDAYMFFPKLLEYLRDPSWARLSDVLDKLSALLTVVTIVLTAALIFASGGTAVVFLPQIIGGLKAGTALVDATKLGVDSYRRVGLCDTSVTPVDLAFDAFAVFGSARGARTFERQAGGWMRAAPKVDSVKWKKWATHVAVIGEGKPVSWDVLKAAERQLPKTFATQSAKHGLTNQSKEFLNHYLPVVGRPDDWRPLRSLLESSATRVQHSITVPRIAPLAPAAVPAAP